MTELTEDRRMSLASLRERAAEFDAIDPLARCRELFALPDGVIYLDGNSLGACPASVGASLDDVIRRQWAERLIRSWDEGWWETPERVGARIAPLVGAEPGEVVVGDSTSVNIFKLAIAGARMKPGRTRVVVDASTFPTNGYIIESAARLLGLVVTKADPRSLGDVLGDDVAFVMMNHVDYRTGELWDMASLTTMTHDSGALAFWDVCHSVGIYPLEFDSLGVDLAAGCTYKYLNGGPGAPAFLYVRAELQSEFDQPLTGWHGHADPFAMSPEYAPAGGILRGRVGTPPLISMLALDAALDAYDGVSLTAARAKTETLTTLYIDSVDALLDNDVEIITPRNPHHRAGQVSVAHPRAKELVKELSNVGVLADFREPNIVRQGFSPLYISHADAVRAAEALALVLG
jgi:kynureninase